MLLIPFSLAEYGNDTRKSLVGERRDGKFLVRKTEQMPRFGGEEWKTGAYADKLRMAAEGAA